MCIAQECYSYYQFSVDVDLVGVGSLKVGVANFFCTMRATILQPHHTKTPRSAPTIFHVSITKCHSHLQTSHGLIVSSEKSSWESPRIKNMDSPLNVGLSGLSSLLVFRRTTRFSKWARAHYLITPISIIVAKSLIGALISRGVWVSGPQDYWSRKG